MAGTQRTGISRLIYAFKYSMAGFKATWVNEEAFRQEMIMALVCMPGAFWLGQGATQQALLMLSFLLIPLTELFNSAIEAIVDRVGLEHHELAGRAKDIGSAAVLFSILMASIVWGLIAFDRFFP